MEIAKCKLQTTTPYEIYPPYPTSKDLVERPEDWPYSSYNEYLKNSKEPLCNFSKYLNINPKTYKEFVESRKDYQKRLSEIKYLLLE